MNLDAIIKSKLKGFKEDRSLQCSDNEAFELFVNETILNGHQSGEQNISASMLETVSIGGANDTGIDGICIKLNGILIESMDDAKDIISTYKNAEIEFIFIQSKLKDKFDSGEYAKFMNGITDFVSSCQYQPSNCRIRKWLEIKKYLISDEVMRMWHSSPIIRTYYVVMGNWNESPHIEALSNRFKDDISSLKMYGDVFINYVDTTKFKKIYDDNENRFSAVINIIDTFSLTPVTEVDNSSIFLCYATEIIDLLMTDGNILRKTLFNDNVRDYQGQTAINQDIFNTIKNDPESFVIMNNGITIICSEIVPGNRKVTLHNPRVVNGCQTCNVLYNAYREGCDISKVVISGKVIATSNPETVNKILRGTNRQNIVYDEAFECTRDFHKNLEEIFYVISEKRETDKIYYERRSKQYKNVPTIKLFQRVSFRMLIQGFVSVFLNVPHKGHRHESRLLKEYTGKIFLDKQSKFPYYVAALILVKTDLFLKKYPKYINAKKYRAQVYMIIRSLAGGNDFDINKEKEIDQYCRRVLNQIYDDKIFDDLFVRAVDILDNAIKQWIEDKGKGYQYGIKDSPEFTRFLLDILKDNGLTWIPYRGTVKTVGIDRNSLRYGFIDNGKQRFFFHSKENPGLDFSNLYGKEVLFDIVYDQKFEQDKAINVHLLSM